MSNRTNEIAKGEHPRQRTPLEPVDNLIKDEIAKVNALDDICEAIDICEANQIPYDGLNDIEDFKERIRLHFRKKWNLESRKTEIEKAILKAAKDDASKRRGLKSVMRELIKIVEAHKESPEVKKRGSLLVGSLLQTEGTSDDLERDCKEMAEQISHGECLILVAGETSAGKSSVLNLLLEEEVLPVHTKSSTSVITIIRYNKKAHAKVVYKTNEPERIFDLDDEGRKELHAIAFMQNSWEREDHNIKEVQVYLPLTFLKSGLVLIDTPGIGENEFLESELINFINANLIHGFMYIIKTDNAGGVQEDRLLNLLKIVINKQHSDSTGSLVRRFHSKSALFICNRFDLIQKSAQDHVRQNAINRLSECWPNFEENQVIFFSAEKAKRDFDVDTDYINDNYKLFLEAVRDLFVTVVDKRIQVSYKWIESILRRTVHHLKSMVKRLDYSDTDLRERSHNTGTKLDSLKKRSDVVISTLKVELSRKRDDLCKTLREYFNQDSVKRKLTTGWELADVPISDENLGNWAWVEGKIYETFYDKMCVCVNEWDNEKRVIDAIETEMSKDIKMDLNLLQEELDQIEREMQDDSSTEDKSRKENRRKSRRRSSVDSDTLSPLRRSQTIELEPKLPIKLAGRLINPFKTVISAIRNKKRLDDFQKDPTKSAEKIANKIYESLLSQSDEEGFGFKPFVEVLLERPLDYICVLEQKIPQFILSNQMLLNMIQTSIVSERANQKEYESMMVDLENLRRILNEYGEGYIFVNDFMKNEIQIQRTSSEGDTVSVVFSFCEFLQSDSKGTDIARKRDIHGLWTVMYCGTLVRSDQEIPVGIRCYIPSSKVDSTFKEVAKLRCLTSRGVNIASFLGIHHTDTPTPAFVYRGALRSVRRFLQSFCSKRECVPSILEDTVCGLEYLHKKDLVHMELSQDTVTVDENGEIKLTGACLPRIASVPNDTETRETGNFVYLAPEVLRGHVYDASADIYSFGLFVIELAVAEARGCIFTKQRQMALCEFVRAVNPETMLDLEGLLQHFTLKTRALIQSCLATVKLDRPSMDEVVEYTRLIRTEGDALDRLPSRHSRRHVIKRPVTDTKL